MRFLKDSQKNKNVCLMITLGMNSAKVLCVLFFLPFQTSAAPERITKAWMRTLVSKEDEKMKVGANHAHPLCLQLPRGKEQCT